MKPLALICMIILGLYIPQASKFSYLNTYLIPILIFFASGGKILSNINKINMKIAVHIYISILLITFITFLIAKQIGSKEIMIALLLTASSPIANVATTMVILLKGDKFLAILTTILTSSLTIIFWPIIFEILFGESIEMLIMFEKLFLVTILPIIIRQIFDRIKRVDKLISKISKISFFVWCLNIFVTISQGSSIIYSGLYDKKILLIMLLGSVIIWIINIIYGYYLGKFLNKQLEVSQIFVQRNTTLGIWVVNTFFSPICTLSSIFYIILQNIYNVIKIIIIKKH